MYKIYRINSGIEFRVGVKTKILIGMILIGLVLVIRYFETIMEYIIAGF